MGNYKLKHKQIGKTHASQTSNQMAKGTGKLICCPGADSHITNLFQLHERVVTPRRKVSECVHPTNCV